MKQKNNQLKRKNLIKNLESSDELIDIYRSKLVAIDEDNKYFLNKDNIKKDYMYFNEEWNNAD